MKEISKSTCLPPHERYENGINLTKKLAKVGVKKNAFETKSMDSSQFLHAFKLPSPQIILPGGVKIDLKNGQFQIKKATLPKNTQFSNWVLLASSRDEQGIDSLLYYLSECSKAFNITVKEPQVITFSKFDEATFRNEMKKLTGKLPQIVVTLIDQSNSRLYGAIKKICLKEIGVPS